MNRVLERDKVKFANQHAPVNQNIDGQYASTPDKFAYEQSMRDRNFGNAQVANQQMPNTESAYNNAYPNTNYNYQQSLQNARNACASSNQSDCYQRQPQQTYQPQMQQNATPYANGYQVNQNAQRDNNYVGQDNGYYAPQNNAFDNINYQQQNQQPKFEMATTAAPAKVGQKKGLNTKVKLLIGVYFFIVTVIVALLLVNALTVDKPVSASQDELMSYKQEVVNYAVGDDGSVQELKQANTIGDYTFDENTNWFDKMCDKIGAMFG